MATIISKSWLRALISKIIRVGAEEQINRRALRLIAGNNVTLTAQDSAQSDETRVTISASPVDNDVEAYGAIGDDSTDNSAAIAAARTAAGEDRPIYLSLGDYNSSETNNLYGSSFKDALGWQLLLGTSATPTERHEPIVWIEKISDSDRDDIATAWDQGAFYGSLEKVGGDAFGAAVTGYARAAGSTTYDLVGVHGRARIVNVNAAGFGGWSYVDMGVVPARRAIGHEVDVKSSVDLGLTYDVTGAAGTVSGLVVATADDATNSRADEAIGISKNTGAGFINGIVIRRQAILPSVNTGSRKEGEAIFIAGGLGTGNRIGGIRFGETTYNDFDYGIDLSAADIGDNAAVWLGSGHRIVWGSAKSDSTYITYDSTGLVSNNNVTGTNREANGGNPTRSLAPADIIHVSSLADSSNTDYDFPIATDGVYRDKITVTLKLASAGTYRTVDLAVHFTRASSTVALVGTAVTSSTGTGTGITVTVSGSSSNLRVNLANATGETVSGYIHRGAVRSDLIA